MIFNQGGITAGWGFYLSESQWSLKPKHISIANVPRGLDGECAHWERSRWPSPHDMTGCQWSKGERSKCSRMAKKIGTGRVRKGDERDSSTPTYEREGDRRGQGLAESTPPTLAAPSTSNRQDREGNHRSNRISFMLKTRLRSTCLAWLRHFPVGGAMGQGRRSHANRRTKGSNKKFAAATRRRGNRGERTKSRFRAAARRISGRFPAGSLWFASGSTGHASFGAGFGRYRGDFLKLRRIGWASHNHLRRRLLHRFCDSRRPGGHLHHLTCGAGLSGRLAAGARYENK